MAIWRIVLAFCIALSALPITAYSAPAWPDTPLGRTQVLALIETLNADLLSHDSATLTLGRWCSRREERRRRQNW